jgi:hypothetical protein
VRGRDVAPTDRLGAPLVVVVNERMAQVHWPGASAIGRRIGYRSQRLGAPDTEEWLQIVGVVSDIRYIGPETPIKPEVYAALAQWGPKETEAVVETWEDPTRLVSTIRAAVRQFDRDTPVIRVDTLRSAVAEATAEPRYRSALLAAFGVLALVLCTSGLYAVLAFRVGRRRREFAIRLALGASPRTLRSHILRHAIMLLVPATFIGLVGAAGAARWLQAQLFEVSPSDPVAFAAAAAIPLVVGLVAAYAPARDAALVDPIAALRAQ